MEPTQTCLDLAELSRGPFCLLVADDEPLMRDLLRRFLSEKGYQVHTAANGREALEVLHEHTCHLVITDLRMPQLDGMQLLLAIKELNPRLPVIFISGYGDTETVVAVLKAGAENFLPKPLDLRKLHQAVQQTLALSCIQPQAQAVTASVRQVTYLEAPSHPDHIRHLLHQLALSAVAVGFANGDLPGGLKLALAEALTNAMEHGNRWDTDKTVTLEAEVSCDELRVTVQDQGPGFDYRALGDPTQSEQLLAERGRGVFIMHAVMDEVRYNAQGNQVTLIKRRPTEPGTDSA